MTVLDPEDMVPELPWAAPLQLAEANARTQVKEIHELKKQLLAYTIESKAQGSKTARLERELKEAEGALAQAEEEIQAAANPALGRTAGGVAPPSRTMMHNLKRVNRELKLELERSHAANLQLRSGLKATNIAELQLESQTYYGEVLRLRAIMEQGGGGGEGGGGEEGAADSYVKPSVATMRKIKEESRVVKAENAELKGDLEKALKAAYKLRSDLSGATGDGAAAKYAGKTPEELVSELVSKDKQLALLLEEKKKAMDETADAEARLSSMAAGGGFKDTGEAERLKARVRDLEAEIEAMRIERDGVAGGASSSPPPAATLRSPLATLRRDHDQEVATPSVAVSAEQARAATQLQAHWRGRQGRRRSVELRRVQQAAPSAADDLASRAPTICDSASLASGDLLSQSFTSGGRSGAAVQRQLETTARRQRDRFFKENKAEVDAAITKLQSALRAHIARKRLAAKIAPSEWLRVTTTTEPEWPTAVAQSPAVAHDASFVAPAPRPRSAASSHASPPGRAPARPRSARAATPGSVERPAPWRPSPDDGGADSDSSALALQMSGQRQVRQAYPGESVSTFGLPPAGAAGWSPQTAVDPPPLFPLGARGDSRATTPGDVADELGSPTLDSDDDF